jgi:hypothetical protein
MSPASSTLTPKRSIVTGPQAVKATEALRLQQKKDAKWPFSWMDAPPASKQDQTWGHITIPAAAATYTELFAYEVPDGMMFLPTDLFFVVSGTSWNAGDFLWSLDLNSPTSVSAPQSLPIDGYSAVPFALGSFEIPWMLPRAELNFLHSRDVLRMKVRNINLGAGQGSFNGLVKGYLVPSTE